MDEQEAVRIFVKFVKVESAIKGTMNKWYYLLLRTTVYIIFSPTYTAVVDLNGRFFGGRTVKASFYPEDRFSKFDLGPSPSELA